MLSEGDYSKRHIAEEATIFEALGWLQLKQDENERLRRLNENSK